MSHLREMLKPTPFPQTHVMLPALLGVCYVVRLRTTRMWHFGANPTLALPTAYEITIIRNDDAVARIRVLASIDIH